MSHVNVFHFERQLSFESFVETFFRGKFAFTYVVLCGISNHRNVFDIPNGALFTPTCVIT